MHLFRQQVLIFEKTKSLLAGSSVCTKEEQPTNTNSLNSFATTRQPLNLNLTVRKQKASFELYIPPLFFLEAARWI